MARQWFIECGDETMYVDLIQYFPLSMKMHVSHNGKEGLCKFYCNSDYFDAKSGTPTQVSIMNMEKKNVREALMSFKEVGL